MSNEWWAPIQYTTAEISEMLCVMQAGKMKWIWNGMLDLDLTNLTRTQYPFAWRRKSSSENQHVSKLTIEFRKPASKYCYCTPSSLSEITSIESNGNDYFVAKSPYLIEFSHQFGDYGCCLPRLICGLSPTDRVFLPIIFSEGSATAAVGRIPWHQSSPCS